MPGRDGTGPAGAGTMTGRGLGFCSGVNTARRGTGFYAGSGPGCRRGLRGGFCRGFGIGRNFPASQKELLEKKKDLLQSRIDIIDKQLKNL